jgi:peptide/nickel transport system permease protein
MAYYLARRTGYMFLILAISSVAIFYALRSAPGGPSGGGVLSALSSREVRQAYDRRLGLDQPVYKQYFIYLGHLGRGDLGTSLVNGTPITELLKTHARNSLILGITALLISYLIAIPLGVLAAVKRNTWIDQLAMGGAILGMGIPNFWLALILVYVFSLLLGVLPSAGCCSPSQLVLPAIVLAAEGTAVTMRMTRSSMLEHLREDFVRALRAKGLPEWQVVGRHVLRNALIPVISLTGLRLGWLVGYALIVETIFRWPGVGYLLVDSVLRRDYPVAQFFSLLLIFFVLLANWLADVGYGLANPRIRVA